MKTKFKVLSYILTISCVALPLMAQQSDPSTSTKPRPNTYVSPPESSCEVRPLAQTPLDQGNDDYDVETTRQIRKTIMNTGGFSLDAQNVKIITNNGRVVLRGLVDSVDEHRQVCQIARNVAGAKNVYDELEIKTTNS